MTGSGCRRATGPISARNSARSRTWPLISAARSVHPAAPVGSSRSARASSRSYSFIAEPQPAELTTIASTPACSNVAIVRWAKAAASASRPECSDSAPQQPWSRGMITSHPSAASTRAVAAFTCGKNTDCTHPVSMPTTARREPSAGTRRGSLLAAAGGMRPPGASRSAAPRAGETRPGRLLRARRRSSPVRCTTRSGAVSARSRRG